MAQSSSRALSLSGLLEEHWRNILQDEILNDSNGLERSDAGSIPAASTNFSNDSNGLGSPGSRCTPHALHQICRGSEEQAQGRRSWAILRDETAGWELNRLSEGGAVAMSEKLGDDRIRHLEMLQAAISRMASASATSDEVSGLRDENARLKALVAETLLENRVLKKSVTGYDSEEADT